MAVRPLSNPENLPFSAFLLKCFNLEGLHLYIMFIYG